MGLVGPARSSSPRVASRLTVASPNSAIGSIPTCKSSALTDRSRPRPQHAVYFTLEQARRRGHDGVRSPGPHDRPQPGRKCGTYLSRGPPRHEHRRAAHLDERRTTRTSPHPSQFGHREGGISLEWREIHHRRAIRRLRDGVELDVGMTSPAQISRVSEGLLRHVIHEGRKPPRSDACARPWATTSLDWCARESVRSRTPRSRRAPSRQLSLAEVRRLMEAVECTDAIASTMPCMRSAQLRGLRGATTCAADSPEEIGVATQELLRGLMDRNDLSTTTCQRHLHDHDRPDLGVPRHRMLAALALATFLSCAPAKSTFPVPSRAAFGS